MEHRVLGTLVEGERGAMKATVHLGDEAIDFKIEADGEPLAGALALAADVAGSLAAMNAEARLIAVRDLLETYNEGWNEYDEPQDDGSVKTVINPKLEPDEFSARLRLKRVVVSGSEGVDFWYDPGELFWGHSLRVASFEGARLGNATAEILG